MAILSRLQWLRPLAGVLAAAAIVATGALGSQVGAETERVLNSNWRGAYDILVTARGQDFGGAETQGLVDANFVSTAGDGGITLRQVAQVRHISDVAIAAPIGMVGALRSIGMTPSLWVTDDPKQGRTALGDGPVLAKLTMRVDDVRSGSPVPVVQNSGYVVLKNRRADDVGFASVDNPVISAVGEPNGFGPLTMDSSYLVPLGGLPELSASIVAVDPAAESALLGPGVTAALAPLASAPQERSYGASAGDWRSMVDQQQFLEAANRLDAEISQTPANASIVPLLVVAPEADALRMTVTIDQAPWTAAALPTQPGAVAEAARTAAFTSTKTVTLDVSKAAMPFASPELIAPWPGSQRPDGEGVSVLAAPATDLAPVLVGRPSYQLEPANGRAPAFRVVPRGEVDSSGRAPEQATASANGADTNIGLVRAYREPTKPGGGGFASTVPAPIGVVSLDSILDPEPGRASYVPSGTYLRQSTTLSDGPRAGAAVEPNLSNLDFITAPPGAITDLAGGAALRGDAPIDAIRVRVAGIDGYTPENQRKVTEVAAQIERLGLTATIVAGSSPQTVALYVPKYHRDAQGTWTDLGWVSQDWTTLGAAVRVSSAFDGLGGALALGTLIATALGLTTTALLAARGNRRDVAVLTAAGWRRSRITRRLVSREVPGLLLLVAAAAVSMVWSGGTTSGLASVPALAVLLATAVVVISLRPAAASAGWSGRGPLVTTRALAWRNVAGAVLPNTLAITGAAAIGLLAGLGTALLVTRLSAAGGTRLADAVRDETLGLMLLLCAIGLGAALLMSAIGRGIEVRLRARREHCLRIIGYPPQLRSRLVWREEGFVLIAFLAVGAGCAVGVLALTHVTAAGIAAACAVAAAIALRAMSTWSATKGVGR